MAKKKIPEAESKPKDLRDLQAWADRLAALLIAASEAHLGDNLDFGNWLKIVPEQKVEGLRQEFITSAFEESIKLAIGLSTELERLSGERKAAVA